MNKGEFINRICDLTQLSTENAETGTAIVLGVLSNRLTEGEASDVESQLPKGIKELWNTNIGNGILDRIFNQRLDYKSKEEFYSLVSEHLHRNNIPITAGYMVESVFSVLKQQIDQGEIDDVSQQLPEEIKEIWQAA